MTVTTRITVTCDFKDCKEVVSWDKEPVENGQAPAPEPAKYLVIFQMNGAQRSFCCQLHAAEFFLPPGYEAVQKQVIQLPERRSHKKLVPDKNWKDQPLRREGPIAQADGSPDNGQETE